MDDNNTKVSVVLTSYNHAPFLGYSIQSILDQSFGDFELLIIDDASTDDSWSIIQDYAQKDPRIRAFRNAENTFDQNCFVPHYEQEIHGEYVAIAHSDDAWAADKLQKQFDFMSSNQDVAACFTWVRPINDDNQSIEESKHFFSSVFMQSNRSRFEWLHYFFFEGCPLCHPSMLIRREAYRKYGLFTAGLHGIPDFCKWVRLCLQADIHVIEEKLTLFRVHADETNTSGDSYANRCRAPLENYFVLKEFLAINDSDTFLRIFPEAGEYCKNGRMIIPFALAQMGLMGPSRMHKLFGLELIYGLLQDPATAQEMHSLYSYGEKDYNADEIKHDIFGQIPADRLAEAYLYVYYSDDYADYDKFAQEYYISSVGLALLSWDLSLLRADQTPHAMVFVPDDRHMRKIHSIVAGKNDDMAELTALNRDFQEDKWDIFLCIEPKYFVDPHVSGESLHIRFMTQVISLKELSVYVDTTKVQAAELDGIKASISWRITRPLRFVRGLFSRR